MTLILPQTARMLFYYVRAFGLFLVLFAAGFLFGAVVSGTDPATLIPLFKHHRVPEDLETIIVTEAIFNGPLAIILTMVALFLLVPSVPGFAPVEPILTGTGLYTAAVLYFLYQIFVSAGIGLSLIHI